MAVVHSRMQLDIRNCCILLFQAHDLAVRSMVWSHNDMWMLTADHGGFVKYWQSNMNNVKMYQAHKEPVRGLRWATTTLTERISLISRLQTEVVCRVLVTLKIVVKYFVNLLTCFETVLSTTAVAILTLIRLMIREVSIVCRININL